MSPGCMPDSSIGEAGHQRHKTSNKSSSGRKVPLHHARRVNTRLAMMSLANGCRYGARRYDFQRGEHIWINVTPGPLCQQVLNRIDTLSAKKTSSSMCKKYNHPPSYRVLRGQTPGSALWNATLLGGSDEAPPNCFSSWEHAVANSRMRPSMAAMTAAYGLYKCKNRGPTVGPCTERRCPNCWEGRADCLEHVDISCSRFTVNVPRRSSSGTGRIRGGDARAAALTGSLKDDWALGSGGGEDVEIWKYFNASSQPEVVPNRDLTCARVLYFFEHVANGRKSTPSGSPEGGPATAFALVYEYKPVGGGNTRKPDERSKHPAMLLHSRDTPKVYPADLIRRHVHLSHACPATNASKNAEQFTCGPESNAAIRGGKKIWTHKYKASSGKGDDVYLLNEHHHSICRDKFIGR